MRRRLLRVAALSALVVAAALMAGVGGAGRAAAVDSIQVGSWWRAQPDGGGVPAPPTVQPNGPWVQSDAAGPSAVSALRVHLGDGESAPILSLKVHGKVAASGPGLIACVTAADWKPVTAGPWSAQPKADCASGSVAGQVALDGSAVAFDLTGIVSGSDINVVLSPSGPTLPVSPPVELPLAPPTPAQTFDVTFDPVTTDEVQVATSVPSGGSDATSGGTDASASSPAGATVETPAVAPSADLSTPAISPTPAPAAPPAAARAAPRARVGFGGRLARLRVHDDRFERTLAGSAFVALAGWWYLLSLGPGEERKGRPRLSLYDAAPATASATPARVRGPRTGRAPALR